MEIKSSSSDHKFDWACEQSLQEDLDLKRRKLLWQEKLVVAGLVWGHHWAECVKHVEEQAKARMRRKQRTMTSQAATVTATEWERIDREID